MAADTQTIVSGTAQGAAKGFLVGGPWGAVIGGVIGLVKGLVADRAKTPQLVPLELQPISYGQDKFQEQGKDLDKVSGVINQANSLTDESLRKSIGELSPAALRSLGIVGDNSLALMAGEVPGRSGFNAADLGITSLDLQKIGERGSASAVKDAQALTPGKASTLDTLASPGALLKHKDAIDTFNNDILNQARMAQLAAFRKSKEGGFLGGLDMNSLGSLKGLFGGEGGGGMFGGGGADAAGGFGSEAAGEFGAEAGSSIGGDLASEAAAFI